MSRQLLVLCDECNKTNKKKVPAEVVDVAIRISDPDSPGAGVRVISGSLEICADHQTPLTHIASMIESIGSKMDAEGRQLLANVVRGRRKTVAESDDILCFTCKVPAPLKKTSLFSHAEGKHECKPDQVDYRPWDPENDEIRVTVIPGA